MAKCLLVYVPGGGPQVADLLPQEELASAAAYIRQAGHEPLILDFGGIGGGEGSGGEAPQRRGWLQRITGRATDASGATEIAARLQAVVSSFLGGLDLVAFLVHERDGLAMSTQVNMSLQRGLEGVRTVCFGGYAERFGAYISAYNPVFEACVVEEAGAVLAGILNTPELGWSGMPGLVIRERSGTVFTGHIARPDRGAPRPLPDYSEAVYPQLYSGEKLLYFPVQLFNNPAVAPSVLGRVRNIIEHVGGAAIHFVCGNAGAEQVEALGRGLAGLPGLGPCSLELGVPALAQLTPGLLRDMGGVAVRLAMHTGSQRLLDDFFAAGFTITDIETACRRARAEGAAVHAEFAFPSPWDDHHTEAETLRLVQRVSPEGVTLREAQPMPGTAWYADPKRFGLRLEHRQLARRAACAGIGKSVPEGYAMPRGAAALATAIGDAGVATGLSVHELTCARALGAGPGIPSRAALLRDALLRERGEAGRAAMGVINAAILGAAHPDVQEGPARIRAAMGN